MAGKWRTSDLPNLKPKRYAITSFDEARYNCIAWAANDITQRWWPHDPEDAEEGLYWPPDVPTDRTIDAFVAAFGKRGYVPCGDNGSVEVDVEKIALYAKKGLAGELVPTHAARQLSSGCWTSKLGSCEDIAHLGVDDIYCREYGEVVLYLKRPRRLPMYD
jgi:hypothetical protein